MVKRNGNIITNGSHDNDMFKLDELKENKKIAMTISSTGSLELWHQRMDHLKINGVRSLASGIVTGVNIVGETMVD